MVEKACTAFPREEGPLGRIRIPVPSLEGPSSIPGVERDFGKGGAVQNPTHIVQSSYD